MTRQAAVLLSVAAFAAPAAASAAIQAAPVEPGAMTLPREAAAVAPWAGRLFDRLDADVDGEITGAELAVLGRPEIAARGGSRVRALVSRSDASNDARVTRDELTAGAARMFRRMDADGDGRLSDAELPPPPAARAPAAPPLPTAGPPPMSGMDEGEDD